MYMTQLCTLVPQVLLTSRVFMQSSSGTKPHFVLRIGKSKYKCDSDCLMFKATSGICSHTLLVAVLNDEVCSFVSSFTKSKTPLNYAQLAQHGLPVGEQKPSSKLKSTSKIPLGINAMTGSALKVQPSRSTLSSDLLSTPVSSSDLVIVGGCLLQWCGLHQVHPHF